MSPWFATSAVLGQLREAWMLSNAEASWLTIAVQIGFVLGALASVASNLADRIPPRRLLLLGTLGASAANLSIIFFETNTPTLIARFITGACLAAVYPSSLKIMSGWFREGRGLALGVMIGSLTLGSALPHLINALGGLQWQLTLIIISILTVVGGVIADRICCDGPYMAPTAMFDKGTLRAVLKDRGFRLCLLYTSPSPRDRG